jgi:hypothetical protein
MMQCWNFRRRYAQAVHPGVDLQVKIDGAFARFARARGRFFQKTQLVGPHDRRREAVVENSLLLAGPEAGEDQYRFANAALAQFGAFRGTSHAEPVRAGLREGARDGNDSVAVGVALDDGENFPARAARPRGIDVRSDCAQIVRQRSQTYFRPDGASIKFYGSCHWNHQE